VFESPRTRLSGEENEGKTGEAIGKNSFISISNGGYWRWF
jgi:hypothetical protein